MTILPKLRCKYGEGIGVEILFSFPELQDDQRTYLGADTVAGVSSLSADGVNFVNGQYVVIGQPGNTQTEIIQISETPTSTSIALAAPTVFPHNRGDIIRFIPYNQITPEFSTDPGVTFTAVTPVSIRADSSETYLQRTTDLSTYVYRFRFYNSTTTLYSTYSASTTATGYGANTIWSAKDRALRQLGEVRGSLITDQFLNDSLQEARRVVDQNPSIFRWSFRTKFGVVLGQMLTGQWSIAAPADLRDPNSPKNILSIRIGDQNRPVIYQDRVRFNQNYLNVVHTTVATQALSGQATLVLTSTHDLPATGTVYLANNSVGDGLRAISYTANNKATNTLSGVPVAGTGSINRTVTVGTDVWLRAVFGLPTAYTISAGTIYFDVPLKLDYDGMDAKMDYYSIIPPISTDDQTFDEPFYDQYLYFLKWKIKSLKANGKLDRDSDPDYKDFVTGMADLISQEFPAQRLNFIPDIEGFLSSTE